MTQGYANGWRTRRVLHGVHHIFIYHKICVYETNDIDSCEEWVRTNGQKYWK